MTHIKISSVPDTWSVSDFIHDLFYKLDWKEAEKKELSLCHIERMKNERYNVRLSFRNKRLIEQLTAKAQRTNDPKVFSIKVSNVSLIVEVLNNLSERFKLEKVKTGAFNVFVVKHGAEYIIHKLLDRMDRDYGITLVDYVSMTRFNCYIKLARASDVKQFGKCIESIRCNFSRSCTMLMLDKVKKSSGVRSTQSDDNKGRENDISRARPGYAKKTHRVDGRYENFSVAVCSKDISHNAKAIEIENDQQKNTKDVKIAYLEKQIMSMNAKLAILIDQQSQQGTSSQVAGSCSSLQSELTREKPVSLMPLESFLRTVDKIMTHEELTRFRTN